MIVVRAPLRLPIGGGGTDLPFYYSKHKGSFISAAINKYIYVAVHESKFLSKIRVKYSKVEEVDSPDQIKHPVIKEALKLLNINKGIEIVSFADVPDSSGLGSSGTFIVALLQALHVYKRDFVSLQTLAEEACKIQMEILKESCGKQDQYIASFGGIKQFTIGKNGSVVVDNVAINEDTLNDLEQNCFMFYTGVRRDADFVLKDQKETAEKDPSKGIEGLHQIKEIGVEIKKALEAGNSKRFGEWMNIHWETKKKLSTKMSDPFIDKIYEIALQNGAIGGKIMGAGGGGFFLFYCDKNQSKFREAMKAEGLTETSFKFDFEGTKVLFNG